MNKNNYLLIALAWTVCLVWTACSNMKTDLTRASKITGESTSTATTDTTDQLSVQQADLSKIYTQAIAAFIKGAYKNDQTTFDTLFFGKHVYGQPDDFPNIELPETIEKTPVRLVTPEIGQYKQQERKSLIYVNMMGWVDKDKAEFIIVVFSNGGQHQYDYFIDFIYNTAQSKFELDKIAFENYLNRSGEKPERIAVYKDGKYVGDK